MNALLAARGPEVHAAAEPVELEWFRAFYGEHANFVRRLVRRLDGQSSESDDLVQEIFLVAHRKRAVSRDELLQQLARAGVSARRGIMAAHLEPVYEGLTHGPLPVTERLTARTLILPLFHELTESEQDIVVSVIVSAGRAFARS